MPNKKPPFMSHETSNVISIADRSRKNVSFAVLKGTHDCI
jgi:hypothetical protein